MYTSKDGKNFGNHEMGRHYDKTHGGGEKGGKGEGKMEAREHEAEGEDIKDVVDEHGPAESVEMHTTHADGHVHKATHKDHKSASKHMAQAFGEEEPEQMENEGEGEGEGEQQSSGMKIPTMG